MIRIYVNGVPSFMAVGKCQETALMTALTVMDPFQRLTIGRKKPRRKR